MPPTPLTGLAQAIGNQPPFEADALERFLGEAHISVLAYLRLDGTPHQVPLWFDFHHHEGFRFVVSTGSPKQRALQQRPAVSVIVHDDHPPHRAVLANGTVELSVLDVGDELTRTLAIRYLGLERGHQYMAAMRNSFQPTGNTLVRLRPKTIQAFDNTR